MKSFKPFIWLSFFIFVFILFEFGLFYAGRFLLLQRRIRISTQGTISIVCIGDSHTFGVGTSAQYSYPKQEETLLNTNNKALRFSIVNLGIPGSSTKRQAQELKSYLENNYTEIVIWLTGRNNDIEIKQWGNTSPYNKIAYHLGSLRSFKFLKVISDRILRINKERDSNEMLAYDQRYADYLNFYLAKIRKLCLDKGSKLVLLSYYNSSDSVIKEFAYKYSIPYLDFTSDFESLFRAGERLRYISPDMSHLNHLGYKFFAEQLYERLFLKQGYLGIKINPLLQRPGEKDFYLNDSETERMIQLQKERIVQSKDSSEYPFELIHLGHIYMEIGNSEAARECYSRALLSSNYSDNNTIVSPIINWYLKKGIKDEALKICEEILLHNPENYTAKYYRERLLAK
jgi:tetratricopeptide (TPR) repeat protein